MSPQPAASPKTILLVDDDSAVVRALHNTLRSAGYDVLAAETQEKAIAAAKGALEIDLLMVDAVMPHDLGDRCAEEFMVNLGLITGDSFGFNLMLAPAVFIGAMIGRRLLPLINQKLFENLALGLSAVAGVRLLF